MTDIPFPSRRRFPEFGSAALAAGALGRAAEAQTKEQVEQAEHDPSSILLMGQDNPALHA